MTGGYKGIVKGARHPLGGLPATLSNEIYPQYNSIDICDENVGFMSKSACLN